jgi:hypothetical protein
MIRGITPIDAAFELMGLHQAQVLMRFIFLESMAGKVIFALGFILSIRTGLDKGNFKPAFVFLMMFFSLWLLLVVPRAKAVDAVSAMERSGYQQITTAQILKKNGYGEVMVSPVLDVFSRMGDSLVMAVAAALDRGGDTRGYLASPFLFIKVSILTSGIVARGITDPQLEERTVRFYQDHFWPAVKKLEKADDVWPGHPDVVSVYKEEGRMQWQALREALYQACDQDKLFSRMFGRFYDGKTDKDALLRSFLAHTAALKPLRYALMTYASGPERRRSSAVEQRRNRGNGVLSEKIMAVLSFMQGGMLFLLWSMFPAFLVITFLLRQVVPLIIFTGVLFSVKAWTLIWVILDKTSTVWFGIYKTWRDFAMWDQPGLNEFIALAAVVLPLSMTGAVIFLGSRIKAEGKT